MDNNNKLTDKRLDCSRCGTQFEEGQTICPNCGTSIYNEFMRKYEIRFDSAVNDYFEIAGKEKNNTKKNKNKNNHTSFFNFEDISKALGILCLLSGIVSTVLFGIIGSAITLALGIVSLVLGINAKKKDGCSIMVPLTTSIIGIVLSGILVTSCVACGKYSIGIALFGFVGGSCISMEIIDMFR